MQAVVQAERFFTVKEVAEMLGFHEQTVRDDIRAGNLKTDKLGPRRTRISNTNYSRYVEWLRNRVYS